MKPQIAHIYRNGRFVGYGLAVNGELIDWQLSADISSEPNELPKMTVDFVIDNQMAENPVRIDLPTDPLRVDFPVDTCRR